MKINKKNYLLLESSISKVEEEIKKYDEILDMSMYHNKFNEIVEAIEEIKSFKIEQSLTNKQGKIFIKKLNGIIDDINKDCLPFYQANELTKEINEVVHDMSEYNHTEIENKVIDLLKIAEVLNCKWQEDRKRIMDESYKVIYQAIIEESALEKSKISHAIAMEYPLAKESIDLLIKEDLEKLPKDVLDKIKDNTLDNENACSVVDDYVIKEISSLTLSDKNEEYHVRKNSATMEILDKKDSLIIEKKDLDKEVEKTFDEVADLKIENIKARAKIAAAVLIPVMVFSSITYGLASLFRKNKVVTTTSSRINNEEKITELNFDYVLHPAVQKGTIKYCNPWHENGFEGGYIREVVECEVKLDEHSDNFYEEALKHCSITKAYYEVNENPTEELDTVNSEWIIIESAKIDGDYQEDPMGYVWGSLLGVAAIGLYFSLCDMYGSDSAADIVRNNRKILSENIESLKKHVKFKTFKEYYRNIGGKTVKLQEEIHDYNDKYGVINEQIPDDLLNTAKRYLKK